MGNSLKMADKQRILALLELGWSYRRIQRETGVRRETVARYDPKKVSKPANVPTGPVANAAIEERDVRAYRLLQGMISFTRKYPKEQVDWACGVALEGRLFRHKHLRRLVYGLIQFGDYLHRQGLTDLGQLRFHHVESFIATQPVRRCQGKYRYPISRGVRGARYLWRYACPTSITPPEEPSPVTGLHSVAGGMAGIP